MRILFIGTGDIGLPALRSLVENPAHELLGVVTQPDKPAGRRQEMLAPPVKQFAARAGIPVFQPPRIRAPEAVAEIQSLRAEVIVVMAYGQILPRAVLDAAGAACLNLHASLLPRHRGAAPIRAAIETGDHETGITVMWMDEGLDTGDVLLKKAIAIDPRETGGSLHEKLAALAPVALGEALALLENSSAPRTPQDNTLATYAPKLDRGHGHLDWTAPAEKIERIIRALNPWPAAFALLPGRDGEPPRKLKIFDAVLDADAPAGTPGEVLRADESGILAAAREGGVLLREVQIEGKRRMSAGEFLRGHPLPPETLLT